MKTIMKVFRMCILVLSLFLVSCSVEDGVDGAMGLQGPMGEQGIQGEQGNVGPEGTAGEDGEAFGVPGPRGEQGSQGEQGESGEQGPQGVEGTAGTDGLDAPARFSSYTESLLLNTNPITADATFQPIGPVLEINKTYNDSKIEVFFNSNCGGGTFNGGASGIKFEVRINENPGDYGNSGSIQVSNSEEFISIFDVFTDLGAGRHNVQIYTRTNGGTSNGVLLDPGGWGGRIIAKETF